MVKKEELRYSKACADHRAMLKMPEINDDLKKTPCNSQRYCYNEGCPIYKEPKDLGQGFKSDGTRTIPKELVPTLAGDINLRVFEPLTGEKPKKERKISQEVENFLWLQQRVMGKLAWRPEIWKALDKLSVDEILDRLVGKDELATVPTLAGGKMPFQASTETKKMFEKLEKEYAEEDEKKGKPEPKGDWGGLGDCVDSEFTMEWVDDKKEGKKNGKKSKNVPEKT